MMFSFKKGVCYIAQIELSGFQAAFGTRDAVAEALADAGLTGARVDDLGGSRYRAIGIWPKPSETVELPDSVKSVNVCPDHVAAQFGVAKALTPKPKPKPVAPVIRRSASSTETQAVQRPSRPSAFGTVALIAAGGGLGWLLLRRGR